MIYVCIPSYNEEKTVGVLLWKIRQVLTALGRDFELLLLDDASTDRTQDVLEPYSRVLPLTILKHKERQGYATSIETLLREAVRRSPYPRRDIVLTIQADFTEDPDEIPALVKRIEAGADVVTAVQAPHENAPRSLRWSHRAAGYLMKRFGVSETGADAFSVLRAYRVYPVRKAVEGAKDARLMTGDRWVANAMLLRAVKPFARRIDTVDVSLFNERRQRPSRLEAWASLKQVFGMRRVATGEGGAPHREGVAVLHQPRTRAPHVRRPSEPTQSEQRRGSSGGRKQTTEKERPRRERPAAGASTAEPRRGKEQRPDRNRPERPEGAERAERPERSERPERAPRAERAPRPPRPPKPAPQHAATNGTATVVPPTNGAAPALDAVGLPTEEQPKKKRRKRGGGRKRKRDGKTVEAGQSVDQGTLDLDATGPQAPGEGISEGAEAPDSGTSEASGEPGVAGEAGPARRRRGGRRGSRGRRGGRGRSAAAAAEGTAGSEVSGEAPAGSSEGESHAQMEGPSVRPEPSEGTP